MVSGFSRPILTKFVSDFSISPKYQTSSPNETKSNLNLGDGDHPKPALKSKKKAPAENSAHDSERLEDQMNYEHLMALEKIFYSANETGNEGLDMDEFRVALKKTMGHDIDDRELDKIFMKVDTNCDGTVDWDEYLSYMLLEYQEKQSMFSLDQEHPLPTEIQPIYTDHSDSIVAIKKMQGTKPGPGNHSLEADEPASRFYSMSKDGTLSILTQEWNLHKTVQLDGLNIKNGHANPNGNSLISSSITSSSHNFSKNSSSKAWLADFVCMPNCNLIAVGGTEYEVVFYNSNPSNIQKKFAFTQLGDCALTMDYKFDLKDPRKCTLVWGDTRGCITIVNFTSEPSASLFSVNNKQKKTNHNSSSLQIPLNKIIAGCFAHVTCNTFKVHKDWVKMVKFFTPPSDENKVMQIVSCCAADDTALSFGDYHLKSPNNLDKILGQLRDSDNRGSKLNSPRNRSTMNNSRNTAGHLKASRLKHIFNDVKTVSTMSRSLNHSHSVKPSIVQQRVNHIQVKKGILCFDFDNQWNLIVTGSRDCDIRVWNMYVAMHDAKKSSTLLKGHKTSVTHIMVNSHDHMVVSISGDKNIRLWDLRDYSCRQSINKKNSMSRGVAADTPRLKS